MSFINKDRALTAGVTTVAIVGGKFAIDECKKGYRSLKARGEAKAKAKAEEAEKAAKEEPEKKADSDPEETSEKKS